MSDTILRTLVWVTNDATLLLKCSLIVIKCRGMISRIVLSIIPVMDLI